MTDTDRIDAVAQALYGGRRWAEQLPWQVTYWRTMAGVAVAALDAYDRERLTALVHAKEAWIDGAKVDLDGYADDQAEYEVAVRGITAERDEARAEVGRLAADYAVIHREATQLRAALDVGGIDDLHETIGADLRERIAQAIDQAWAEAKDRRQKSEYREGYLDGLEHAERIARSTGRAVTAESTQTDGST